MRRRFLRAALALGLLVATASLGVAAARAASSTSFALTPVQRIAFPERGYVVDLPRNVALPSSAATVTENGQPANNVSFKPLAGSNLSFGAVLAVDASDSMRGGSYAGAVAAARTFVDKRSKSERIGLISFNGAVQVLQKPTLSTSLLHGALANPPKLAYGTKIYDALEKALTLIKSAKLSTAAIVLLTDGSDIGSKTTLKHAVALAQARGVRIFTIGLRSKSFDPRVLRSLATQTGGAYALATSPDQLAPIYASLSGQLAREYVLEYSSVAPPKSQVTLQVGIRGFGAVTLHTTNGSSAALTPYHESFFTRFMLSVWSLFLLALVIAGLLVYVVQRWLQGTRSAVVARAASYSTSGPAPSDRDAEAESRRRQREWRARAGRAASTNAQGALARLDQTLEIAEIDMTAGGVVGLTLLATVLIVVILAVISPILAVLGLVTPLISRALVRRKLNKVRSDFADQLPSNLQVLASALRSGYSFSGALATVVEQAQSPSKRELRRVVADDQLGVPLDEALRRVAKRMDSRDLEQVALVAELQRTTGGNVAEVLDVVVATIRDRQDVRRLLRTLTAQGRMARWILTGLPIVTGLAFYGWEPGIVGPFYAKAIGQVALVVAAIMVTLGSLAIQKVIDIEV